MSRGPSSMPSSSAATPAAMIRKVGYAQEVEPPRPASRVLEPLVEEVEHLVRPSGAAAPVSASTTRSSFIPRLPFTSTTSPARSCGLSHASSGSTSVKWRGRVLQLLRRLDVGRFVRGAEEGDQLRPAPPPSRPAAGARPLSAAPSSSMSPSTATARPLGRQARSVVERGGHRGGVGVVAVVEHRDAVEPRRPVAGGARAACAASRPAHALVGASSPARAPARRRRSRSARCARR